MKEKSVEDCRAIKNEKLLTALQKGGFKNFVEFVKLHDELVLCFRGNDQPENVVIYYNNHQVWKLFISRNDQLSVQISFNHARYSKEWKEKYETLCSKYKFARKKSIKNKENEIDINKLTASIPYNEEFSKEFVKGTFDIMKQIICTFFNPNFQYDYFKATKKRKADLLEKRKQQELYIRYNNLDNGIFVYDLEFTQRRIKDIQENNNQSDMLGIEFKNAKPNKLLLIEVKSKKGAMPGGSGLVNHITKMEKYAKDKNAVNNRMIEAKKILEQYKMLELRNIKQTYEISNLPIKLLVILTDEAEEYFIRNKLFCEKRNMENKNLYRNFENKGYDIKIDDKLKEIYIYKTLK